MPAALTIRAWRELSRRRARTAMTVLTLAVAVAGVWIFVTPDQLDVALDERAATDLVDDVILRPTGVGIDEADLARIRALSNVTGFEARAVVPTDMRTGDRVQRVFLVGVRDFDDQQVNRVRIESGRAPGPREAVTDPQNRRGGRFDGGVGSSLELRRRDGTWVPIDVSATGTTLHYANTIVDASPVLYVPNETVWEIGGFRGHNRVEIRMDDRSDEATLATIEAVRVELARLEPGLGYNTLPEVRPEGQWPGEDEFDNFVVLFWVIGGVSLLSALVLIGTTMNTLVREQRRVIGIMKALGGRQRRIVANFALTAVIIGSAATAVGTAIGIPLGSFLVEFLATETIGTDVDWQMSWSAVGLGALVGVGGAVLASLPALRAVARTPVHEALGTPGIEARFGASAVDRGLGRLGRFPRTWQLGLRAVARRKGRSAATVVQISLAVGTMLAFGSAVITMVWVSEQSRNAEGGDLEIFSTADTDRIDDAAAATISAIDGVDRVQPIAYIEALVGDTETFAWGLPADPVFGYELDDGRWFTAAEVQARADVAVVGPALAEIHDLEVGDTVAADTLFGPLRLEVVGIDTTMVGDGRAFFVPLSTALALRGSTSASWLWLTTTSADHDDIDRVASTIGAVLAADGYQVGVTTRYLERAAERNEDQIIVGIILAMGLPVVAIGMIGLVNTMATTILDRSREIGVLRSLGARARDVRRIFRVEAVVLVLGGWFLGIGVGWVIARLILTVVNDAFHVTFPLKYPAWPLGVALVVALLVATLALARPLRRASRLPPSEALRYQ